MDNDFSRAPGSGDAPLKRTRGRGPRAKAFGYGATLLAVTLATVALFGCSKSGPTPGSPQAKPTPKPLTDFEQKLQYVRNGQFTHIYVFSRKDGGAFDKEDVAYLTENSPTGEKTNMRVKTDDGRRVVIGTNFEFTQENFDALYRRFQIEDYTGK